jgi:DNA-damage-inducible protein J
MAQAVNVNSPKDPFYSESNLAHLRRAIEQLESGGGTFHELIEVDDEDDEDNDTED